MAKMNSYGYLELKSKDWWLVKSKESGKFNVYGTIGNLSITFPKYLIGRRVRLKVEFVDDYLEREEITPPRRLQLRIQRNLYGVNCDNCVGCLLFRVTKKDNSADCRYYKKRGEKDGDPRTDKQGN